MSNQIGDSVFTKTVTCSSSDQKLDLVTSRNHITIIADGDCFINFDNAVTTTERLLIKANIVYTFEGVMARTLHYLSGSTPNLYVMAFKTANVC